MYPSLPKTMSKEPVLTYSHAKHEHFSDMILFTLAQGNADSLKCIRKKLYEPDFSDLTVIDFTTLAQGCKAYDEFIGKIKDVAETNLTYHGIAICTPTLLNRNVFLLAAVRLIRNRHDNRILPKVECLFSINFYYLWYATS